MASFNGTPVHKVGTRKTGPEPEIVMLPAHTAVTHLGKGNVGIGGKRRQVNVLLSRVLLAHLGPAFRIVSISLRWLAIAYNRPVIAPSAVRINPHRHSPIYVSFAALTVASGCNSRSRQSSGTARAVTS